MKPPVQVTSERLEDLDALAATTAWLSRDFAYDEEHLLILAIRRNLVLDLSDVEIKNVLYEAAEHERLATEAIRRLLVADRGSEVLSRSSLKPR
jgi:hypothetical protein